MTSAKSAGKSFIIQIMKHRRKLVVAFVVIITTSSCFIIYRRNLGAKEVRYDRPVGSAMRLALGIGQLDGAVFDETYIDKNIRPGMRVQEVEGMLGKPYRVTEFMGTDRASYKIRDSSAGAPNLSGITVVYDSGTVKHVDKSWNYSY